MKLSSRPHVGHGFFTATISTVGGGAGADSGFGGIISTDGEGRGAAPLPSRGAYFLQL